jgi:hypothetical protein
MLMSEIIELFIEDQAFSLSYDLAPLPSASCLSFSFFKCVAGRAYWRERGGGGGGGANQTTTRKPGPLLIIQCSLINTLYTFCRRRRRGVEKYPGAEPLSARSGDGPPRHKLYNVHEAINI